MKKQAVFSVVMLGFIAGGLMSCHSASVKSKPSPMATADFVNLPADPQVITGMKQITFEGNKSGEGYFSADGKKMIFQSDRKEDNPFYQIYLMDLQTGKTDMISTGRGKTTCSWIHPSGKKVMFSSTHMDPDFDKKVQQELEARKSNHKARYSWSFDDTYQIYEKDLTTGKLKQLTHERGYNAEGDYSPDGKWIVFASNRLGYSEKLSPEDAKIFAQDPSYMSDIYIMKADGTGVKRLTHERGYNGGPFFSADGKKIVWRRFSPLGQIAEIYTMNIDGSNQRPMTHLKAMSWAPFFHPSGDYIIFTTNLLGFQNFELFIVDSEGKHAPVRVTYLEGFDGLPVFSPDGTQLSWTRKNDKGESQIYLANWDDAKARALLGLPAKPPKAPSVSSPLATDINAPEAKKWVEYLASPYFEGRATGGEKEPLYMSAIASWLEDLGMKPVGDEKFFSNYEFVSGVSLGAKNQFQVSQGDKNFSGVVNQDFVPLSFSATGSFAKAPVAFVGYGIKAPATDSQPGYDSYRDIDVKGKWALAFADLPEKIPAARRVFLNTYAHLQHKALIAKNKGAVGLILVTAPESSFKSADGSLLQLKYDGVSTDSGIPVINVATASAEKFLSSAGVSLGELQKANDEGEIKTLDLPNVFVQAQVDLNQKKSKARDVVAALTVPGAKSAIVIGAHVDHLGHGEIGRSLARGDERGQIHPGADDNASGVAGVLLIAEHLRALQKAGKLPHLKHDIVFALWTGEEIGMLGSSHYLNVPHKEKLIANINMDMIGRLRDKLVIQGVGSAKEWKEILAKEALKSSVPFALQDDPYVPSDSMEFYTKEVPGLTFFTGGHADYHTPRDTADKVNYEGLTQVAKVIEDVLLDIAVDAKPLTYTKAESSHQQQEGRSFRVYLGTIPDYAAEGIKGVKITGTSKNSPAEKAGLQAGDVIVEVDQTKIATLYDYVYCLQAMKPNIEVKMKILREGKEKEFAITPLLKE